MSLVLNCLPPRHRGWKVASAPGTRSQTSTQRRKRYCTGSFPYRPADLQPHATSESPVMLVGRYRTASSSNLSIPGAYCGPTGCWFPSRNAWQRSKDRGLSVPSFGPDTREARFSSGPPRRRRGHLEVRGDPGCSRSATGTAQSTPAMTCWMTTPFTAPLTEYQDGAAECLVQCGVELVHAVVSRPGVGLHRLRVAGGGARLRPALRRSPARRVGRRPAPLRRALPRVWRGTGVRWRGGRQRRRCQRARSGGRQPRWPERKWPAVLTAKRAAFIAALHRSVAGRARSAASRYGPANSRRGPGPLRSRLGVGRLSVGPCGLESGRGALVVGGCSRGILARARAVARATNTAIVRVLRTGFPWRNGSGTTLPRDEYRR